MLSLVLLVVSFALTGVALFWWFRAIELSSRLRSSAAEWRQREEDYTTELARLEKIKHIPDIVDRARKLKGEIEAKLSEAQAKADQIIQSAVVEAQAKARRIVGEADQRRTQAEEALKLAVGQARQALDAAEEEAKDLASKARKDAKDKREKSTAALELATQYALEIRTKAEERAEQIAGEAYQSRGRLKDYEASVLAFQNRIKGYEGVYLVPPAHILDELAEEFGFSKAGEKLKLARERTKLMQKNGTAAVCGYPDGWKKDHALKFVLSTFDGKVDTVLSRVKPGNQGKLIQEIKDAYALVNRDGEVYKNARIQEEYLDSRLEEVKWATAVQKLKEKAREEQRAIKEQIREEQRAKKEFERAIKQAEREEELVNKAIAKLKKQFEAASEMERAALEAQLEELNVKLVEAEEKGKKAVSMAQQTKKGHVYVISNVGSFGDNVYKIGLTRRLDPHERIKELGGASVPFPFDVHAMIAADDAPALENALHKRFVESQVNKLNRRKEFFRVSLQDLKDVTEELQLQATWTIEAEASQYRETIALESAMKTDTGLRRKWLEDQATLNLDEAYEDAEQELEEAEV